MHLYGISIHALRVEGDESLSRSLSARARFLSTPSGWRATLSARAYSNNTVTFLSTPSGWRATSSTQHSTQHRVYFYPRPPGGGRPGSSGRPATLVNFYPRPPGGGRLAQVIVVKAPRVISIHALRVEGDRSRRAAVGQRVVFLSTPSGWRATKNGVVGCSHFSNFYPRPPGGGRP